MPQLDTSTWSMIILMMIMSLFIIIQLKISTHYYYINPQSKQNNMKTTYAPWKTKWTKIYLPLL